ncbi:MAG: hypothetical protein M3R71_01405, partial [Actinomycetota bacterium]|nr:hypothetical protein [Actinomycetota bacterium]
MLAGSAARATPAAVFPAGQVPVTAHVGGGTGHNHEMGDADANFLLAARAKVGLPRLKRLNPEHLKVAIVVRRRLARRALRADLGPS